MMMLYNMHRLNGKHKSFWMMLKSEVGLLEREDQMNLQRAETLKHKVNEAKDVRFLAFLVLDKNKVLDMCCLAMDKKPRTKCWNYVVFCRTIKFRHQY